MPSVDSTYSESPYCAFVLQDENNSNSGENKETSYGAFNQAFQINTFLNSNTPNTNIGDKTSAPQNVTLLPTEVVTTKDSSSNLSIETKSVEFTAEASKQSTDINKVPKLKTISLPTVVDEMSPTSISISEAELESHDSKSANRGTREPSESTPHNSPTPEQLATQSKPETQVWTKST
jgi:hypothetical protein